MLGFLTTHLKSSEAEPVAKGARFWAGLGGAEYEVGVGNENIEAGFVGGVKMVVDASVEYDVERVSVL